MSRFTFILGGARSGKSRYAQELAAREAKDRPVVFVATAQAGDSEMETRIARHQADRPAHWRTAEEPLEVTEVLQREQDTAVILIDCLTFFVTNHLLRSGDAAHCDAEVWDEAGTEIAVTEMLRAAQEAPAHVILVSNEVGLGLVPETPLGRVWRDAAGRANQQAAQAADEVIFMVAGLPLCVKATSTERT
ncbi:MAG: bifunctional adenosylcobinamide kinase/adenosylcobinamide-phosphate guanylyltransferase [Armatimonadota bacterium]|nr:bifunctional adenosylcobinamide kinase/adenosylcobinamide-phosphate guanylyltransferase [Armatimonadota bacterium]